MPSSYIVAIRKSAFSPSIVLWWLSLSVWTWQRSTQIYLGMNAGFFYSSWILYSWSENYIFISFWIPHLSSLQTFSILFLLLEFWFVYIWSYKYNYKLFEISFLIHLVKFKFQQEFIFLEVLFLQIFIFTYNASFSHI